jgi:hypothetical protein
MTVLDTLRQAASDIEEAATDALAGLGPWLAPIPSAALVARASVTHLGWSQPIGLVAGAIIEVLGLTATSTALALWDYNESKRKTDPAAPLPLAIALVGFYYASTVGLTVLLDIAPTLSRYAPALFPTLALVGTVNLALRAQLKRRVAAIKEEKAARNRTPKTARKTERVPETVPAQVVHYADIGDETKGRAWAILMERPGISGSELGRLLGRSERLGRKLRAEILPQISGNDRGAQ